MGFPIRSDNLIGDWPYECRTQEKLFEYFSGLAILISCRAVWRMASYTMEQRTKEFGKMVRQSCDCFPLPPMGFVVLVCMAFVISTHPFHAIDQWLNSPRYLM